MIFRVPRLILGVYLCFSPIPGKKHINQLFCWKIRSFQKFYLGIFSGFWSSFYIRWRTKKSTKKTSRSKLETNSSFKIHPILTEKGRTTFPCLVHALLQGPWNLFDALCDLSKSSQVKTLKLQGIGIPLKGHGPQDIKIVCIPYRHKLNQWVLDW